jgi:NADP-dependent 3-hydroxy acid dehydrogenase YdfG
LLPGNQSCLTYSTSVKKPSSSPALQGLERQFTRVLSAHGAAVALAARQTAKLKSLEEETKGKGGRAAAVQVDVTDTASIGKALAFAPRNDLSGAAPP